MLVDFVGYSVKHKNLRLLSIVGSAYRLERGPSYQEEARQRSLLERGDDGVDLGADLDVIDEARGQLRSERRRAGLGT